MSETTPTTSAKQSSGQSGRPADVAEPNFTKRECILIAPTTTEPERCGCGLQVADHQFAGPSRGAFDSWKVSTNTKQFPTDAYGVIEFNGGPHPKKARYLRLSFDSRPEDVLHLLENRWKLGRSKLVISILGNSEDFGLQFGLAAAFVTGLMKAWTAGVWVICTGLDSGVAKHLPASQNHERPVLIGIAPWGMLKNRDHFTVGESGKDEKNPDGAVVKYSSRDQHQPWSEYVALLDSCTHLLLVDNGTTHRYGADLILRRRLEEYIRQQAPAESIHKNVPMVGVLIKGGEASLRTVLDWVLNIPGFPVVILEGSGGAADLIGFAERCHEDILPLTETTKTEVKKRIARMFRIEEPDLVDLLFTMSMRIARQKKKVKVFRLVSNRGGFYEAMLTALKNAKEEERVILNVQ